MNPLAHQVSLLRMHLTASAERPPADQGADTRDEIHKLLADTGPATIKDISESLELPLTTTRKHMMRLFDEGRVECRGRPRIWSAR